MTVTGEHEEERKVVDDTVEVPVTTEERQEYERMCAQSDKKREKLIADTYEEID